MNLRELIITDPDILGGQAVFKGTRVSVESLFDHLEAGISLNDFLEDFPSVSKDQVVSVLEIANRLMTSQKFAQLYEAVA